ncbi:MAG: hypothetical protein JRF54_00465 [Deltaproteobacteria bacterium]|nr:hypothetical protein [Deltaproteobacteria bacterium]
MSALVAVADLSWRQTMSNISYKKRRVRVLALEPKPSASANSAILACVVISDRWHVGNMVQIGTRLFARLADGVGPSCIIAD